MPAVDSNDPGAAGFSGSTVIAEFESLEAAKSGPTPTRTLRPVCTKRSRFDRTRKCSDVKKAPQELFETFQHNEIKGFISGHVHILTTSIQEAPLCGLHSLEFKNFHLC
jgi:hypothetical protein